MMLQMSLVSRDMQGSKGTTVYVPSSLKTFGWDRVPRGPCTSVTYRTLVICLRRFTCGDRDRVGPGGLREDSKPRVPSSQDPIWDRCRRVVREVRAARRSWGGGGWTRNPGPQFLTPLRRVETHGGDRRVVEGQVRWSSVDDSM